MATRKSPLRDRLLSNSPDPIKSSILRDSGMGWGSSATSSISSSGSSGSITSPLRIAKRDSPGRPRVPSVARRTSSSYRHVHNNNLVSKSPFKSQIPTPSAPSSRPPVTFPTRRVSGEKRPRPASMHEQAETENDRPFALKRDRKQSKTFQGLIEKEPVTKSPFKSKQRGLSSEPKQVPILPQPVVYDTPPASSTPPSISHIQPPPVATSMSPSPARSALVSRRLHGPRLSGGAKRERRKTVTFHERCDVLEFDRDEDEDEEVFESADEEVHLDSHNEEHESHDPQPDDGNGPFNNSSHGNDDRVGVMEDDASYESVQSSDAGVNPSVPSLLSDPDASITGIVEQMFFSTNTVNLFADVSITPGMSTPPRRHDIPTDLETEDGVPFGRSHHVERFLQHNQHPSPHPLQPPHFSPTESPLHRSSPHRHSPSSYPYNFNLPTAASPHGPPATPPRRSPGVQHSTPPLGRSTHAERILKAREEQREEEEEDAEDVDRLPVSPSPIKKARGSITLEGGLIPRFDFLTSGNQSDPESNLSANMSIGPFAPRLQDDSILSDLSRQSKQSAKEGSTDLSNLSVGSSEVGISRLSSEHECTEMLANLETPPRAPEVSFEGSLHESEPPALAEFQSAMLRRTASPASNSGSPLLAARSSEQSLVKTASRERISREDVQRRLHGHRLQSSPSLRSSTDRRNPAITIGQADDTLDLQPSNLFDKDKDRMSVLTTQTDFSTETAIIETVEKRVLGMATLSPPGADHQELGMLGSSTRLQFDFGSKFGLGGLDIPSMDDGTEDTNTQDTLGTPLPKPTRPASIESGSSGVRLGDVDVDMEMKSALDRLMEDVAGAGAPTDDSMLTDEYDESFERSHIQSQDECESFAGSSRPKIMERAMTDPVLLQQNEADGVVSRSVSGSSSITLPPPPVPPKDNIKNREQLILERRREARRLEEEADDEFRSRDRAHQNLGVGRPSRRRSMSTGDAEVLSGSAKKRGDVLLDVVSEAVGKDDPLSDSIEKELQKLSDAPKKSTYYVREREGTIYATSSVERISHMAGAGDVDAGRAWKMVRRPSDMNEYAKQIKEYRAQDKGKAYGKVFVKVLGIKGVNLPLPQEPTAITCTLNNGIHFVTTPECQLSRECRIEQEFELIEHSKLEFTLTLKVRRDPHIIAQYKTISAPAPVASSPPVPPAIQAAKSSGKRSFWSSSPKKSSKEKIVVQPPAPPPQPQPVHRLTENLARHLKPDGTLARAFISFRDIANHCDTRVFETKYPLIGQRVELGGKYSTMEVGEIVLKVFRLPPLPGLPQDQLPQSLEECHRGLRHINWHKATYFEGILTQNGGDCSTLHRRPYRIIGSNLIAFSDITKKATATIDLKKAIAIRDDQEVLNNARSPAGCRRYDDDLDGLYALKHSFRLIFPHEQEIVFSADNDESKVKWLEVLRALVGHIPPHPIWGELLWQRQEEITKLMAAAQQSTPQSLLTPSRYAEQR